jgi:FtsH-binding integral membrane protein
MDDMNEPFLHYKDDENNSDLDMEISKNIRNGFICKVYGILGYQILLTSIVVILALFSSSLQSYMKTHIGFYYLCFVVALICLLLPLCSPNIYRTVPTNYIVLTVFTLSYSWMIATVTCFYTPSSVISALFLTFITVVSLTIYAWKADKDFTVYGGTLFTALTLLLFASILYIFIRIPFLHLAITYGGLILFAIYLIYDTQLLIGSGKVRFSEDDYILAVINIYLDVVILFLKILSIVGNKK